MKQKQLLQKMRSRERKSRHAMEEFGPGKKEFIICPDGGEVYQRKHWYRSLAEIGKASEKKNISFALCPFHQMARNKQFEGEIVIENAPQKNRDELIRLIRRSGEHGERRDPMDRVIALETKGSVTRVTTSENQLAQKIARKIRSRFRRTTQKISRGKVNSDVVRIRIQFLQK